MRPGQAAPAKAASVGIWHNLFVLWNFRTLKKLRLRIETLFLGQSGKLWRDLEWGEKLDLHLGPVLFPELATLQLLAVAAPERLPLYVLGDDQVAAYATRLRRGPAAALYRTLAELTGLTSRL